MPDADLFHLEQIAYELGIQLTVRDEVFHVEHRPPSNSSHHNVPRGTLKSLTHTLPISFSSLFHVKQLAHQTLHL
jgi:hypothetical protein